MRLQVAAAFFALTVSAFILTTATYSRNQGSNPDLDRDLYSTRQFVRDLGVILKADQKLKPDDLSLWPKVADITRRLARNIGVRATNDALDRAFRNAPNKLYSRIWAALPGSTITGLQDYICRRYNDIYDAETKYTQIRQDLLEVVAANPSDRFVEFGYYALGEFDKALEVRPDSPIKEVLHYAIGFDILSTIVDDAFDLVQSRTHDRADKSSADDKGQDDKGHNDKGDDDAGDDDSETNDLIGLINQKASRFGDKPLADFIPTFAERAAAARPHFELVLRNPKSPLADDAGYMLGWLAYHQGQYEQALQYFAQGMIVGNGDYKTHGSVKQTIRIFARLPASRQYALLKADDRLARQTPLWYVAARSAYRDFDYGLSAEISQAALRRVNLSPDRLPVTTDPSRIDRTLARYAPQIRNDDTDRVHVSETAYLFTASGEHKKYLDSLSSIGRESPERTMARAKVAIIKYSGLLDENLADRDDYDPDFDRRRGRAAAKLPPQHRDLRQALHLIEATLTNLPADPKFVRLREWLHYRKVRILATYAPGNVGEAVVAMEKDVPTSQLLDDALAEQIFAEGLMLRDIAAAQQSFNALLSKYPNGNAVDNAHSWMAIIFRCAGQTDEAQAMNREIIRRFPMTRHALYAMKRMANPSRSFGCPSHDE